jgi:hypothetical protein
MDFDRESPNPEQPRPELSPGHPEFDAFLSAPLGEGADAVGLTVMSALARVGLDPWTEAARLADLPRETAAEALALSLGQLPPGSWTLAGDLRALTEVARRLADSLPRSHRPVDAPGHPPAVATSRLAKVAAASKAGRPLAWALYAAIAVAFYLLLSQLQPDHQLEPASRAPTAQQ